MPGIDTLTVLMCTVTSMRLVKESMPRLPRALSKGIFLMFFLLLHTFSSAKLNFREDLFITSKLWNTFHGPSLVRGAIETTLKNLNLKYIDLYLIHWPMGYQEGGDLFPKNAKEEVLYSDVDYVDTWKSMESLVDAGLTKSIGVSNFNSKQIDRVLAAARIPPVTNQVECHPYLTQTKLAAYLKSKNITLTAYSPLGSPNRPWYFVGISRKHF